MDDIVGPQQDFDKAALAAGGTPLLTRQRNVALEFAQLDGDVAR